MKESLGALGWILGIVILVICAGLMMRGIRMGLEATVNDPNAPSALEIQSKQQKDIQDMDAEIRRATQKAQRDLRDAERKMRSGH